jgi:hypothetical protein
VNQYDSSGNPFAALLLGTASSGSMTHEPTAADASSYMGWYVQDDFKVTRSLTLNLGCGGMWSSRAQSATTSFRTGTRARPRRWQER